MDYSEEELIALIASAKDEEEVKFYQEHLDRIKGRIGSGLKHSSERV